MVGLYAIRANAFVRNGNCDGSIPYSDNTKKRRFMRWRCKSRIRLDKNCEYQCEVECTFEPRGCLFDVIFGQWEIID